MFEILLYIGLFGSISLFRFLSELQSMVKNLASSSLLHIIPNQWVVKCRTPRNAVLL